MAGHPSDETLGQPRVIAGRFRVVVVVREFRVSDVERSHDRIFENNKKWAEEMAKKKPEFFKDLSAGQSPDYLWIGKSTVYSCKGEGISI